MIHFQEIIVHTAVTLKQIAIPLYIFASELHPIKAVTSRDIVTLVNSPKIIRNTLIKCCNIIDTVKIARIPMIYTGIFHSYLYVSRKKSRLNKEELRISILAIRKSNPDSMVDIRPTPSPKLRPTASPATPELTELVLS